MCEYDMGHAPDGRRPVGHEGRVAGEERINQHGLAGEIEPEGRVAIPGDLHEGGPWLRRVEIGSAGANIRHRTSRSTLLRSSLAKPEPTSRRKTPSGRPRS